MWNPINVDELVQESAAIAYQPPEEKTTLPEAKQLLSLEGVEGYGLGENGTVTVFVRHRGVANRIPPVLDGRQVSVLVSGEIRAQS